MKKPKNTYDVPFGPFNICFHDLGDNKTCAVRVTGAVRLNWWQW